MIPRISTTLQKRLFHNSSVKSKNPFAFYDLLAKTPKTTFDPNQMSFNHSELTPEARVRLVFGQTGVRNFDRGRPITIAGLKLLPRPQEPNNCCMSGCIDCVWEGYKEELSDWQSQRNKIKKKLLTERTDLKWPVEMLGPEPEARKTGAPLEAENTVLKSADDELSPSIAAFLKTEKRLKEKKRKLLEQHQQQSQQQHQQQQSSMA